MFSKRDRERSIDIYMLQQRRSLVYYSYILGFIFFKEIKDVICDCQFHQDKHWKSVVLSSIPFKINIYLFRALVEQPFMHALTISGVENWRIGWKLKPLMMCARRMFNQRAERKLQITKKRKTMNVSLFLNLVCVLCVSVRHRRC